MLDQTNNVNTVDSKFEAQIELEHLYSKNHLKRRISREFNVPEVIAHCEEHSIPVKFGIDLLTTMVIHKRANVAMLVSILHHHFETLQDCADMLLQAARHNLVDYSDISYVFIMRLNVTSDVYEELERYQYPLPLLVQPKEITKNYQSGYYTFEKSVILRNNHHNDDVYLEHLNRCNKVAYTINMDTATMIQNRWADLDHQRPNELLKDYQQRVKAFEKYDRSSRAVLDILVENGNEFYLSHRYDKRGRCYCQGYHVTYQGNDWNKAVIEFAQKEVINVQNQEKSQSLVENSSETKSPS